MDDTHEQYIRTYYPHIKNVYTQPLGAIRMQNTSLKTFVDRKYQMVFLGTYLNPNEYYALLQELPSKIRTKAHGVIEALLADTQLTFEEAARMQCEDENAYDRKLFPVEAQMMFLADIYIRAYFREQLLKKVGETGCKIDIFGENYTGSGISQYHNVCVHPAVSYAESLALMGDSRFVLNMMPWFKSGIHDRVLNAMINGAVSVSDTSTRMEKTFKEGTDYLGYQLNYLDSICGTIEKCQDIHLCEAIAEAGR
jgi:hypothetical protein